MQYFHSTGLESADSCVKLSNVMKGYKDIAYGLHGLANSYEKTKEKFEHSLARKKSKINRLALGIKSECKHSFDIDSSISPCIFLRQWKHDLE